MSIFIAPLPPDPPGPQLKLYLDFRDWWIGYYRGERHHYVCVLPCVVLRWGRRLSRRWKAVGLYTPSEDR